jgi:hypothetical protein
VREKHCWMAADSADKSKRTGRNSAASSEWRWGDKKAGGGDVGAESWFKN